MGVFKAYTFSSTWPWWWWHFETLQRLPRHETSPTIHRASFVVLAKSCNWNGWFKIPYLALRRSREAHLLRFIVSKSRSSAVGVSYIRKDHLPDWTQIAHNNTKLTCIIHRFLYLRRACRDSFIIYLWHGNEQPKICISTSSRGNLVHLRRARGHCNKACTEFRSSWFPLLSEEFHSKIKFTIVFIPIYCLL